MSFLKTASAILNVSASASSGASKAGTTRGRTAVSKVSNPFGPAPGRFVIGSLDDKEITVYAQYNPSKLTMSRGINWQQQDQRDNRPEWMHGGRVGEHATVEYTGAEARTLEIELVFDGFEKGESVESDIRALERLACVVDPDATEDHLRRPHHCAVVFGGEQGGTLGKMRCVITKLSVLYSMFAADGSPVRATATLMVREAVRLKSADFNKLAEDRRTAQQTGTAGK